MPLLTTSQKSSEHTKYPSMFRRSARCLLSSRHITHNSVTPSPRLSHLIPPNSWDSHMHVIGDLEKYPLSPNATYTPHTHLLHDAMAFEKSVSLRNIVLVQPSIYGIDNSCLLDTLRTLGPLRSRGVVTFDPDTISQATLEEWHRIGVRGVRVNIKSVGRVVLESELAEELCKYADIIRPFGWVLQLWIGLESMPVIESIMARLRVKVCVDHFGGPRIPKSFVEDENADPYTLSGFQSLVNLLTEANFYVKMSAPYRLTNDAELQRDIEPIAREILRVAGRTSVVFATDWPHTRFHGVEVKSFADRCLRWCGKDEKMVERLFRGNAEDLWDVRR
ncbi:hypothetical protein BGZ60DRAFT_568762 [Tricladium varicosporioides]|nr:hypothetical protein BGZ60DRAFT_568762 [Hymenoscyphus varicosporioides]